MAKLKKSTRKFAQRASKGGGERNKKVFKSRRHAHGHGDPGDMRASDLGAEEKAAKRRLEDMGVDEFLDGGFEDSDTASSGDDFDEIDDVEDDDMIEGSTDEGDRDDSSDGEGDGHGGDEDEDGDDDEDFAAAGVAGAVAKDNTRLKGEISTHKAQLEALKARDPEFYAYLQATDADLLDFQDDEDGEDDEEVGDDDDDDDGNGAHDSGAAGEAGSDGDDDDAAPGPSGRVVVTSALVAKWTKAAKASAPLGTMRHLVKAYRMACHYGDSEEEVATSMRIASGAVYNQLMLFMLKEADGLFRRMLGIDKKAASALTVEDLTRSPKWKKVGPLVKSYWGNSLHLLSGITDAPLHAFALRRLRASCLLVGPFRKLADKYLKASLEAFGSAEVSPRVQAFLGVRALAIAVPDPYMERCLKGVYRTFLANSKFVSASSAPHIAFMSTCCVELWGLDLQASYAHAFSAIRQLALSMRGALSMKTPDAYKEIYSWQGVNCLELWTKVLCAHADKAELRPLVYPLTQLLLGAARLVPTPRFFPLRLRLVRALNRLAQATGFFIPVSPLLLEMLHWGELHKPPRSAPGAPGLPDMAMQLRAGSTVLRTPAFQEEVITQVQELLADHLAQWACSIAFPELAHMVLLQLRRFVKTSPVERFRRSTKQLVDAIDRNAKWVGSKRDGVDFSPKDVTQVNEFLRAESTAGKAPLQQFNRQLAARAEQRAAMRRTDDVTVKKRGKKRNAVPSDDEDDEDEDGPSQRVGGDAGQGDSGGTSDDEGDDEDDDEGVAAPSRKKAKAASVAAALAELGAGGDDDGDDMLRDYQLSDDDDDDDEVIEGSSGSGDEGAAGGEASSDDSGGGGESDDVDTGTSGSDEDADAEDDGDGDGGEADSGSDGDFVDMMRGAASGSDDDDGDDDGADQQGARAGNRFAGGKTGHAGRHGGRHGGGRGGRGGRGAVGRGTVRSHDAGRSGNGGHRGGGRGGRGRGGVGGGRGGVGGGRGGRGGVGGGRGGRGRGGDGRGGGGRGRGRR